MTLKSDKETFARLFIIQIQIFTNVNLEKILEHELSPVLLSIVNPGG